ncbi:MAG: hypothetical protein V2A74_00305, partial [bacterium]
MRIRWFPWRFLLRHFARRHGLLDPFWVLSKLEKFSQPSEVAAPIELLRAGIIFHTRGLMNTRAIQNNLDWVWPYWVERQFDPHDDAFLPRSFSITHTNLTHRNWTAIGYPGCDAFPLVDPRGLVTPFFDRWSLDGWVVTKEGDALLPSLLKEASQELIFDGERLAVKTVSRSDGLVLASEAWVEVTEDGAFCRAKFRGESNGPAWLVVALRPYNPEGICFVHSVEAETDG